MTDVYLSYWNIWAQCRTLVCWDWTVLRPPCCVWTIYGFFFGWASWLFTYIDLSVWTQATASHESCRFISKRSSSCMCHYSTSMYEVWGLYFHVGTTHFTYSESVNSHFWKERWPRFHGHPRWTTCGQSSELVAKSWWDFTSFQLSHVHFEWLEKHREKHKKETVLCVFVLIIRCWWLIRFKFSFLTTVYLPYVYAIWSFKGHCIHYISDVVNLISKWSSRSGCYLAPSIKQHFVFYELSSAHLREIYEQNIILWSELTKWKVLFC